MRPPTITAENLASVATICIHHLDGRVSSSRVTTDERDLAAIRRPGRIVILNVGVVCVNVVCQAHQAAAVGIDCVDIA